MKKNILNDFIKKLIRKLNIFLFDKRLSCGVKLPIKHILVINWDGKIGDSIVSSFFYREIRKIQGIVISVITTEPLASLYASHYCVDNLYIIKNRFIYLELLNILKKLKNVDTVVHLVGYMNMKDLFFISRLNLKNIFSLDDNLNLSNIKTNQLTNNLLMHDKFSFILNQIGVHNIDNKYIIPISNKNNLPGYDIVFNPFASRLDKSLAIDKSIKILNLMSRRYKNKTIGIMSSPYTKEIALKIAKKIANENITVIDKINTFYDAIDIVNNSNIIISVDTSIVHIASGLNKKLIAIYYKQSELFNSWLPKESINTKVIFSLEIGKPREKNMNNFSDNEIIEAVDKFHIM